MDARDDSQPEQLRPGEERVVELREEQLVARKQPQELGEIIVRTETVSEPARLEIDALREEVEVVHEPVGETVAERRDPWEEDGALIVPVYEEQLVVSKRLVLRERLRVRRLRTTERRLFEDTLKRERLVVDDPQNTRMVHEVYPTHDAQSSDEHPDEHVEGNVLIKLVTRALE
jgi:uncharacterized protein (TIGR02271 family)